MFLNRVDNLLTTDKKQREKRRLRHECKKMSTEAKKAKSDGEGGEIKQDLPLE